MAAPIARIPAKVRLLQINGITFKAFVEQETDRLKYVGLTRAIFPNQSVHSGLEAEFRLKEVSKIPNSEF